MAREYRDSGIEWIGQIPKEWEVLRTKNVFSLGKDLVGSKSSQTQLLSLTTKGIKEVSVGSTSGKVPNSYDTYQLVHKDNLVFCLFDLDCSAVFSGVSNYEGMISPAYKVVSTKEGFYSKYYGYWFDYIFDGRKYKFLSKNIRYSLTYDEFAALGIVAPKFEEQQKIADYLDKICGEVDEMVALQETMIEELKAYKQSVITEAVTKGLNPNVPMRNSGIDWIGEIPEHWDVIKLGRIFSFQGGFAFKSDGYVAESNNQVIRIGNVKNNLLLLDNSPVYIDDNLAEIASNYKLNENCILFTMTGTKGKRDYFFTLLLKKEHLVKNLFLNQRVGCFIAKENVCPNYYNYLLKDNGILDCIFFYETGTANQGNLGIDSISRTLLQMPPYDEQRKIASYLDTKCSEIDSLIALKQTKIEELKEYKKSVIYEYVTGKKVIE